METVRSKDGTTIAFDRAGRGDPLILVGGAFSQRAFPPLADLVPALESHFTVYNYDRRGRGDSGDTPPYAVPREVEDLAAIIGAAGGSANVYGISSGAALALEAAASGLAIKRLALLEPPLAVADASRTPPQDLVPRVAEMVAAGRNGDAVVAFFREGIGLPAETVAEMRQMPMWMAFELVAHTIVYDLSIVADEGLLHERAPRVSVPTLVIAGGESSAPMRDAARALADAMPDARLLMLEGQDHAADPAAVAPALIAFFSE